MKISTMGRHIAEGGKSLVRNGWMTFASVSSIAISLFILGVFVVVAVNVDYFAKQIENQVEIRVFLDVNTPQATIDSLQQTMTEMPEVGKVTFVSKAEGLQIMRERMGDSGRPLLEGLDGENNPLNDSFNVEVREPRQVAEAAAAIAAIKTGSNPEPIIKVDYGKGTVETLFTVTRYVRYIGIALVLCLGLTAMFLISNTIKLTIMARNREIRIMKLVGATNSFIRWPFFIEGALLGFVGSLIPVILLTYGYWELMSVSDLEFSYFMELKPFEELSYPLGGMLLLLGVLIGVWGSTLSVRKFLKV
ncbi:permease-like cell division protein FtsX [Paenibacillus cymbidii]|uniref:permease-like cell division protein FtsX n=1 Tax=Paenibacillus cymbidii TaxID=1639034 RepID=UPI0010803FAE|nr:permease-like cell division protein FtsX [Paenibacillus cymbidii]